MKTIYEIYFLPSSPLNYFSKVENFFEKLRNKEINYLILSFSTKRVEELIRFFPSYEKEISIWNRLKRISFPLIYKNLDFSKLSVPSLIRFYEIAKRICEKIGEGTHILFFDKIFDLREISEEIFELGFKNVVIFDKNYPEFSKIKISNDFIRIYNPIGKKNMNSPYSMIFKEKIEKEKEEDAVYINASCEEFFYLTEKYFENSDEFFYKKEEKDFLKYKKIEDLFFKLEYLISYKGFCEKGNYSFLIDYVFEKFTEFLEGEKDFKEFKKILREVYKKMGFENEKNGKIFNPFPFKIYFPDKDKYLLREIKSFEFLNEKKFLNTRRNFKVRKLGNNIVFIHKEKEEISPLVLKIEIKRGNKILKETSKEKFFEKGKYYKINFENFKFEDGEIKLKEIYSQFYPYVIFEGIIKVKDFNVDFVIPFKGESLKALSYRLKFCELRKGFVYLLYSPFYDFAIFSPFPYFFEIGNNEIRIKMKEGPFLLVFYPFPFDEKNIYENFLSYFFSPIKIFENMEVHKFFIIKDGIFLPYSLRQIGLKKFLLRGICISDSLKINFPSSFKEIKIMDLKGEKEIENPLIYENELTLQNKKGKIITLLINF